MFYKELLEEDPLGEIPTGSTPEHALTLVQLGAPNRAPRIALSPLLEPDRWYRLLWYVLRNVHADLLPANVESIGGCSAAGRRPALAFRVQRHWHPADAPMVGEAGTRQVFHGTQPSCFLSCVPPHTLFFEVPLFLTPPRP